MTSMTRAPPPATIPMMSPTLDEPPLLDELSPLLCADVLLAPVSGFGGGGGGAWMIRTFVIEFWTLISGMSV